MILDSPQFLGLKIYVGQRPEPGSFYCPKSGDTLSHIANWAYGAGTLSYVLRINKSPWNIENCVYRKKSTKCTASVVYSQLAASQNNWSDGAWLALCPGDRQPWSQSLGLNYPVLWIPGLGGEEPGELADAPIAPAPRVPGDPIVIPKPQDPRVTNPTVPGLILPPTNGGGGGGGGQIVTAPAPKSKWPWILGLVLVAGVGGTAYYFYRQGAGSPKRVYA